LAVGIRFNGAYLSHLVSSVFFK